ncbi:MAG: peptidoglycan DD-metalloendopeptidase family protein [Holosporales bacterium]|nr:peptidoglycan DD-metalloendopeptidase family protein [Holosporales bacterium]
MVIKRSQLISVCLLVAASSIALVEYVSYPPVGLSVSSDQWGDEDDPFNVGEEGWDGGAREEHYEVSQSNSDEGWSSEDAAGGNDGDGMIAEGAGRGSGEVSALQKDGGQKKGSGENGSDGLVATQQRKTSEKESISKWASEDGERRSQHASPSTGPEKRERHSSMGGYDRNRRRDSSLASLEKQMRELIAGGDDEKLRQAAGIGQASVRAKTSLTDGKTTVSIGKGDTLASVLSRLGISKKEAHDASNSLTSVFDLKNLKIGQEIAVVVSKGALKSIELSDGLRYRIISTRSESGRFKAQKVGIPVKKIVRTVSGAMSPRNPVEGLVKNGVQKKIAAEAMRAVNSVTNVHVSKDPINYEFLYNEVYNENGNVVGPPELVYASVLVRGQIFRVYKFQNEGTSEYVDSNGVRLSSLAKSCSMLSRPLSLMKVNSGFGYRVHPTRRSYHMHTGVDLKAPVGTPVYASASGTVSSASYYAGYGKYIKLTHSGGVQTAYGHLSRISVRNGQNVKQGQVIGYSGSTGRTTGAHLHYEVLRNGKFINPLSFVKQNPERLSGIQLVKFNRLKKQVNLQVVGLTPTTTTTKGNLKRTAIKKYS